LFGEAKETIYSVDLCTWEAHLSKTLNEYQTCHRSTVSFKTEAMFAHRFLISATGKACMKNCREFFKIKIDQNQNGM
jgi:hypothetical protein